MAAAQMSNRQTPANRYRKRRISLPVREQVVIQSWRISAGFRGSFRRNRAPHLEGLSAMVENSTVGIANRNQRLGGRSWVYFIQRGEGGPIKIGRSRQLSSRITALQSTCPEEVTLLGSLPETDITESRVHTVFREHRIRGEWFRPAPEIIELAKAGEAIYRTGYCQEIPSRLTDQWLIIRQYTDAPRKLGGPSPFDLVSARLEEIMGCES